MLKRLESEASKVGLKLNVNKTEAMAFNQEAECNIKANNGDNIKIVNEFKYLGSYIWSSSHGIEILRNFTALARSACHKMDKIWKSALPRETKIRLFTATIEYKLL